MNAFAARPLVALLGVFGGAAVALLLIPATEYYLPNALVPAGLAMTAGLLLGPALAVVRSPPAAFRAEHLLMFGLVYWIFLDALQGSFRLRDVSYAAVEQVFAQTALFAAFLWLGSALAGLLIPPRAAAAEEPSTSARFLFGAGLVCFALGCLQATVSCAFSLDCLVDSLFRPRYDAPWFNRGFKGLNQLMFYLKYFGYLVLPLLVALVRVERRVSWRALVLAPLCAAFLLLLLRDGGRKEVGTVLASALLVWLLLETRLRPRHYAVLLGGIAALLLLLQVIITWRDVGVGNVLAGSVAAPAPYAGITVDRNLERMSHIMQTVPARAPHTGTTGILYIVGYPIPRSVWPTKPVSRGIDLPRYMGREYPAGYSWNCTAVGDFYLIGGTLAVCIGGLLFGVAANLSSRLLLRPPSVRSRLIYAVAAMTLFLALRAVWELMAQGTTLVALVGLFLAGDLLSRRAASRA